MSEFTPCVFQDIKGRQGWGDYRQQLHWVVFSLVTNGRQVTAAKLATTCVGNRHSEMEKKCTGIRGQINHG